MKRLFSILTILLSACANQDSAPLAFLLADRTPRYLFTDPEASDEERFRVRSAIVEKMDAAQHEIAFWFYGLNEPHIIAALKRASNRGVRIRLTGSSDQDYSALEKSGLSYRVRARTGLQHAKLMLIDRSVLISGTGNFTRSGMMYNNNLFFISRVPVAVADQILYSLEFEDRAITPLQWQDNGAFFRMMISPVQGRTIQSELIQSVLKARMVRILIFSFTDTVLATALLEAARNGTSVEAVIESSGRDALAPDHRLHDIYGAAGAAPLILYADKNERIYYDENNARHGGKLHHKTMIVDDRILTGSFNYSISARDRNLETFFEIKDPLALSAFHDEFRRIRSLSAPIPRPPHTPDPVDAGLLYENGRLCADNGPVHLFRGQGAFFRGLLFQEGTCKPSTSSAGFQSSSDFDPGSGHSTGRALWNYRPTYIKGVVESSLAFFHCFHCDPCKQGRCRAAELSRISLQAGWLQRSGHLPVRQMFLLHQNGLEEADIIEQKGSFIRFEATAPSSVLLFFVTQDNGIEIACAARSPPAALSRILLALPWFYPSQFPSPLACTVPDESL